MSVLTIAKTTSTIAFILLLFGCTSTQERMRYAEEKAHKKNIAVQNADIKHKLRKLPRWILNPPAATAEGVFAVGIGDGDTFQVAQKRAILEAEYGLARQFWQEISGSERQYTTDDRASSEHRYEALVDKMITQVPMVGYVITRQEIKAVGGKYQSYVLLYMPHERYHQAVAKQQRKVTADDMKEAFSNLQKRMAEGDQPTVEPQSQRQETVESHTGE